MLAGVRRLDQALAPIRRLWPGFMCLKTLMVGCSAGEAHLDHFDGASLLASRITALARQAGAHLVVLKEFPAKYRSTLNCFEQAGFKRVPSMPMTRLSIGYANFDEYLAKKLSKRTRQDIRRKLRCADQAAPIEMTLKRDVTPLIGEVYPLYLQVLKRSKLQFEKLTPEFFCRLGQTMPDKARFFLWRQNGHLIAFALCMVQGNEVCAEYLGMDYAVALDLHLYHYVTRDVINWAISNGYQYFTSTALNYDPKFHMRHILEPLDLYILHTNPIVNRVLRLALPLMEPTRYDTTLRKFPNFEELKGSPNRSMKREADGKDPVALRISSDQAKFR